MPSAPTREELHAELAAALQELFETEPAAVVETARLYEDLDIDSIDTMDLLLRLRQSRGRHIEPELFRDTRTVGGVLDVLQALD
ncbi:acyl carrier protein [Mangrovimicrobium sediminis]|uniref:Acyl carrier protein n=1 Tax=Mangrovimicrobium sediminis TaxID=2562682 RepID=A0A4Z0LZ51_9GAMM|nr:acyl carrier protein [Haliea sp. SAOS-164]TGD72663.1 acyl carrier protein [Haliea sp. SAOS-164]